MWEIILGSGLTIVVAILAEKYEGWKKKGLWVVFVLLVVALAIVQIRGRSSEIRHAETEKGIAEQRATKLEQDIKDTKTELEVSLREQARMSGHLEGIQNVMENFAKTGFPGFKEFAAAALQLLHTNQNEAELTNQQLCVQAKAVAKNIRSFQADFEKERNAARDQEWEKEARKTDEQVRDLSRQFNQGEYNAYQQHDVQFRTKFMPDAESIRDSIVVKLSPAQRSVLARNNGQADGDLTASLLAGAFTEWKIADYLDEMSKMLCDPKTTN